MRYNLTAQMLVVFTEQRGFFAYEILQCVRNHFTAPAEYTAHARKIRQVRVTSQSSNTPNVQEVLLLDGLSCLSKRTGPILRAPVSFMLVLSAFKTTSLHLL